MGNATSPVRPRGVRSWRVGWKTQPTMRFTLHVLQSVGVLELGIPIWLITASINGFQVRSAPALAVACTAVTALLTLSARDLRALRTGHLWRIRPSIAFVEVCLGIGGYASLAVGLGPTHGAALVFTCMPALAATFFGDNRLLAASLAVLTAALVCETALLYPAQQAATLSVAFIGASALLMVSTQSILNAAVRDMDRMSAVNTLAATAGTLRHWPGDLVPVARDLAAAMDVDRYLVYERPPGERPPGERPFGERSPGNQGARLSFAWPDGDWVDSSTAVAAATQAMSDGKPRRAGIVLATPVHQPGTDPAAPPRIAVVTPFRSTARVPVDPRQTAMVATLLAAMAGRADLVDGLTTLANTDELTGVANRRRFFDVLEREMARATRTRSPLSVAMIDLDEFKAYNDRHGHGAGDHLLRQFADAVARAIRAQDLLARYGGEEFVLVLPDTAAAGAYHLLQAVRRSAPGAVAGTDERVSFSAGVATWDGVETVDHLVMRADRGLYAAKSAGRDRVVAATAGSGASGAAGRDPTPPVPDPGEQAAGR